MAQQLEVAMVAATASLAHGAMIKIYSVIMLGAVDREFRAALREDVDAAIRESSLDLSRGEVAALKDVVKGTRESSLSRSGGYMGHYFTAQEPGSIHDDDGDPLAELRRSWEEVVSEEN